MLECWVGQTYKSRGQSFIIRGGGYFSYLQTFKRNTKYLFSKKFLAKIWGESHIYPRSGSTLSLPAPPFSPIKSKNVIHSLSNFWSGEPHSDHSLFPPKSLSSPSKTCSSNSILSLPFEPLSSLFHTPPPLSSLFSFLIHLLLQIWLWRASSAAQTASQIPLHCHLLNRDSLH